MTAKHTNATGATNPETSRRDVFKTGPAFTGAAILGEALNAVITSAVDKDRQDVKDVQLLCVQNAQDVVIKDGRLTLRGISPTPIFFSDRPRRIAGHMP